MASRSRGAFRPRFSKFACPSFKPEGAQGMPGARCTRGLVCQACAKKAHTSIQGSGGSPTSPAQWLYGLLRALPGERAFLPPSSANNSANLAPASRRQDHTTSPYALAFSSGAKNTPDAKASTASRAPRVVTIMIRPSCGRETGELIILISRNVKRFIFSGGTGQPKSRCSRSTNSILRATPGRQGKRLQFYGTFSCSR
jgi:hypothetical protein